MAEPIKLKIRGSGGPDDAPTADDFLDQVRDFIAVLRGVEAAIDEGGQAAIEWRITNATRNSPIGLEATPFARQHAVDISARADAVRRYTADGFRGLQQSSSRPAYFSEQVLGRVQNVAKRVLNGLASTDVDFGGGVGIVLINQATAQETARNADLILRPPKTNAFKELGTVEGYYKTLGSDQQGNATLWIKNRRTGDTVKCRVTGDALEEIRGRLVGEVLDHRRLRVRGTIYYKQLGKIDRVVVDRISFMPDASVLPAIDDIIDRSFTGGVRSDLFIRAVRDGRPN